MRAQSIPSLEAEYRMLVTLVATRLRTYMAAIAQSDNGNLGKFLYA